LCRVLITDFIAGGLWLLPEPGTLKNRRRNRCSFQRW